MDMCACGKPIHFPSAETERIVRGIVARLGEFVLVTTPSGSWKVQRYFLAAHGLKEIELPALAIKYGWQRIS